MNNFWTFFAFPLNLLLALLWACSWGWLWKNRPDGRIIRFLLSPAATVSSITMLVTGCLWIGFSGNRELVQSVPFVLILLYLQTVIYLITLRGWRRSDGAIRWRFLLIHMGLLLALGAGFWGSPDSLEMRAALDKEEATQKAYKMDGSLNGLGYELRLVDYKTEVSADGKPSYYEATISVNDEDSVKIFVNHPYNVRFGEDIYLASVSEKGCVFQIVREPWRYFALGGILMLLVGAFLLFIKGPGR